MILSNIKDVINKFQKIPAPGNFKSDIRSFTNDNCLNYLSDFCTFSHEDSVKSRALRVLLSTQVIATPILVGIGEWLKSSGEDDQTSYLVGASLGYGIGGVITLAWYHRCMKRETEFD